jgi:hypothetical protein
MNTESTALAERKVNHQVADPITGHRGLTPANAAEAMELAKMMAASHSAVPKHLRGQPGACLGIIDDALRMGVSPYALARKSYFVNDQLAYEAQVFMALVNSSPILKQRPEIFFDGEAGERRATVTATFRDGATREYRSPRFTDIHPKNSPLWKSDPDQQLSYYALRAFARRWCPEIVLGFLDAEEIRDRAMTDITPTAPDHGQKPLPRSIEDFAAAGPADEEISPEEDWDTSSEAAGSGGPNQDVSSHPSDVAPQGAAAAAESDDEDDQDYNYEAEVKATAIDQVLKAAASPARTVDQRLSDLDDVFIAYSETLDPAFVKTLVSTATKVVRGELKADAAKKYLGSL